MTSISALMSDITDKIKIVPSLGGRVGFTAGGKPGDPTMRKAKVPFAWPVYAGDVPRTNQQNINSTPVTHEVIVKVCLAYTTEAEMNSVSYPVLQDIINEVTASTIPSIAGYCARWTYLGQSLEEIDERLVYVQRYSVQGNL